MLYILHDSSHDSLDFVARFPDSAEHDGPLAELLLREVAVGEREVGGVEEVAL